MNNLISVLDKGYVRLVEHMGSDLSIVRAARVSYNADWRAGEDESKDEKLIKYLWKNRHTSPFEAVTLTFEIKAPIFVFRQWHRHRTQSYNEVSARYTELEDEFYSPNPRMIGQQSVTNKQVRDLTDETGDLAKDRLEQVLYYESQCEAAFRLYHELLEDGWPRELARMVLPLSTYSRMFTTMNLLNLFRFLTLRTHEHAQWEIRQYANALAVLAGAIAPTAVDAWRGSNQSS